MAIEEQILSEISRSVARVSDSSESFRTTANQQNSNIQRIVKDISTMFRQQSASQKEMLSSIDELNDHMDKANEKNEGIASSLSETIAVQNSMLGELKGIGSSMDNLSNMIMMMMQSGSGGTGGGGGGAGSIGDNLSSMLLRTLGLAGAVAVGAAGANMASNMGRSEPGGDQISNILAAIKQKETGGEADPYTAIQRGADNKPLPLGPDTGTGAYQFIPATWKESAAAADIDVSQYPQARDAPPELQDKVAKARAEYLLKMSGGDISMVPAKWNGGASTTPENMSPQVRAYQKDVMDIAAQQRSQNSAATQTSASSPNTSTDFKEFLAAREQPNVDAEGLKPDFANRLMKAIQAAEQATGEKVMLTSGVRTYAQQAQLYANKHQKPFKGRDGKLYEPNDDPEPYPVAFPGQSLHESGDAVDIAEGPARDWIRAHASEYGLQDLEGDPPHFTSNGKRENTTDENSTDLNAFAAAVAFLNTGQPQQGETLMAGLGMPAGMGPSSEPTPVGMGDMSSYNPMGILGALSGGNMFGPSGQMGAAAAAISALGAAASQFEPSAPDDRGARLNRAAVQQTTETAAPWVNPDAPQEQPMQQESAPQQQRTASRIDPDMYNPPEDRTISPPWYYILGGVFQPETGGIFPSSRR